MASNKFALIEHEVDFCVVGGGLAGLCAAVAAARHGATVALMQERPMLGGNASSEIRMWVSGAHGKNNRETGIIEELSLEAAMERLNERERYIINLRFFEGKTQMEVADQINISQAQVSRLEKNALKIMRQYLLGS